MNRDKLTRRLGNLLGVKNWNRLQMRLKFHQYFHQLYTGKGKGQPARCYVYIADGRTAHGGISDRLRGIISVYQYCKSRNIPFRINFTSPFNIDMFIVPNRYDWELKEGEFVRNKSVGFRFFNSYSHIDEDKEDYFSLLDSKKRQVHCYTNVTIDEPNMHVYFEELFKPSKVLQDALDKCHQSVKRRGYVSITFRFQDLLGDLHERYATELGSKEDKEDYISHCLSAIERVYEKNKDKISKVLVTADSQIFLERAKKLPYVYVVPGEITHIDFAGDKGGIAHIKDFLDMFMISGANHVYFYSYGRMYGASRFAKTAALIGGKTFTVLRG